MAALRDFDEEEQQRAYKKTAAFAWEELAAAGYRLVAAFRAAFGRR